MTLLGPLFSLPIPIPVHPLPFVGCTSSMSHFTWHRISSDGLFEDISLTVQNVACKCVDLNCVVISGQWNITRKENNKDLFLLFFVCFLRGVVGVGGGGGG